MMAISNCESAFTGIRKISIMILELTMDKKSIQRETMREKNYFVNAIFYAWTGRDWDAEFYSNLCLCFFLFVCFCVLFIYLKKKKN